MKTKSFLETDLPFLLPFSKHNIFPNWNQHNIKQGKDKAHHFFLLRKEPRFSISKSVMITALNN